VRKVVKMVFQIVTSLNLHIRCLSIKGDNVRVSSYCMLVKRHYCCDALHHQHTFDRVSSQQLFTVYNEVENSNENLSGELIKFEKNHERTIFSCVNACVVNHIGYH